MLDLPTIWAKQKQHSFKVVCYKQLYTGITHFSHLKITWPLHCTCYLFFLYEWHIIFKAMWNDRWSIWASFEFFHCGKAEVKQTTLTRDKAGEWKHMLDSHRCVWHILYLYLMFISLINELLSIQKPPPKYFSSYVLMMCYSEKI